MNVLVITTGALPVPATKGGAVEKLIEEYIDYNEEKHIVDFTVYTISNDNSGNAYKYTRFRNINENKLTYKIEKMFRWVINNLFPKVHIGNVFINRVIKDLKVKNEKYDLIIVENIPYNVLFIRKLYPKTKIIYHIHNDFLNTKTKKGKKIINQCDLIIAVSNFIKNRIMEIEKTNKIKVIYNGIDVEKFNNKITIQEEEKTRNHLGFKKDDIIFLFVGRLVKEKGIRELIKAFNKVLDKDFNRYNNLKLFIVGNKSGKSTKKDIFYRNIEKIALKHKENIKFSGYIPYEKLPEIYKISNVQIVPSKWNEAFGNVVVEGMASGISQIVTNDGGIPEIVNLENAILIDKKNLIENLYESIICILKDKDKIMKKNKALNIEKFSKLEYCKNVFNAIKLMNGEIK